LNLASGNALLRLTEKQRSEEPLIQGQMAVIEDRSSGYAKLVVALFAVEQLLLCLKFYHWPFAAQALRASGPAETHKQFPALFIGREHGVYIN
jgi:hypothetical protein